MKDLLALVPMGSVATLFWFVMRAVLGADRRERAALAAFDLAHEAAPSPSVVSPLAGQGDVVAGTVVAESSAPDPAAQAHPASPHDAVAEQASAAAPGEALRPSPVAPEPKTSPAAAAGESQ